MRYLQRHIAPQAALATAVSLVLGACSMDRMSDYTPRIPDFSSIDWNPYSKASLATAPLRTVKVTPADYVSADGSCAAAPSAGATQEPAIPGIGLEMTECAIVQALGTPEKIEIGVNERGDRAVTLLYSQGERPGLYRFTAGQLTLIERVEPPPPPPKPAKPQKPASKPRRIT